MSKVPCGGFELDESLALNNGKLGLAPGAGGGGAFVVNCAIDEGTSKIVADKTYAEISEAVMGNNMVIAVLSDAPGSVQHLTLSEVLPDVGALFSSVVVQPKFAPKIFSICVAPDNTVTFGMYEIK